jgi:acyl-CoA thioester hydrolase
METRFHRIKYEQEKTKYNFSTTLRVRFAETDAQGVVYNGNYFTYFEVGRVNYFRNLGIKFSWSGEKKYDITVAEACCQYKSPARFDDELEVFVRVPEIRHTSFIFEYLITRKLTGEIISCGHTVMVILNADTKKPTAIPDEIKNKILEFEKLNLARAIS